MTRTDSSTIPRWRSRLASVPPFSGKLRLINLAAATLTSIGRSEQKVCLWEGAEIYVDLRDRIQRQMWCGCYEPHVMRALRGILRDGDVFLDLGAHNRAAKTCARMAGIDPEMTQRPGVVLPRDTGKWIKWSARQEVCQPDCETWILHLNGALGAESFEDNG